MKKIIGVIIAIVVIAAAAFGGYKYYLHKIEEICVSATKSVFDYFKGDSDAAPSFLPKEYQQTEEEKEESITEQLLSGVDDSTFLSLVSSDDLSSITSSVVTEILNNAEYEIKDVETTTKSCTITVTTKNKDYVGVMTRFAAKVTSSLVTDSTLVDSIKDAVSSFLGKNEETSSDANLTDKLQEYYEECKADAADKSYTGTIVYEKVDGEWTVTSFDENLVSTLYGLK